MKNIILFYLLMKSAWKRDFSWFDISVAYAVTLDWEWNAPSWLTMIGNMNTAAKLPEAWADFRYEMKAKLFGGV